jgi:hypothetical protein
MPWCPDERALFKVDVTTISGNAIWPWTIDGREKAAITHAAIRDVRLT